ncbi:hypothetical protein ACET3Z_009956 [Daucus carota]
MRSFFTQFKPSPTKLNFQFGGQNDTEPSTNQTYASLLKNLTFVKTFSSGILVQKTYIWPLDKDLYLEPHTSAVLDAHKEGLKIYASDFSNDVPLAYDYDYDPVAEYLNFIENDNFSVDGVLSDFPITPSEAIGSQVKPDFSWLQTPPRLPGPWWWFIPPHKPGSATASHGKWPGAHPPYPQEPRDQSSSSVGTQQEKDSAQVHSDSFFALPGRMLPWWWLIQPGGLPHNSPKRKWAHPPLPHSPTPAKPPGHSPASAGLEATGDNDIEAAATAAIEKCWSPLAGVGNCVYDILSAFTTGTAEFDSACCSAINNMAEECVASFHNQEFADTLSNYCSIH